MTEEYSTRIKVCGLHRTVDVEYVNEALPEYAGMVFWEPSKRNVGLKEAIELRKILNPDIYSVGVFVDRDPKDVIWLAENKVISHVQLHGNEDDEYISFIRSNVPTDTVIIKAYEVSSSDDIKRANESIADMILIDSGKGSGKTFDWSLLELLKRDYFLAGGLSADNVCDAIKKYKPYAVDVSSKVETDGNKDLNKILEFCAAVRSV